MLDKPETNELDRLDRFAAGGDAPATDATEADAPWACKLLYDTDPYALIPGCLRRRSEQMLAYLFWHTPRSTVARADYERDLLAFSRALSDLNCPGVRRITSFRTSTVPWLDDPSGYEDWATIDSSCALETLNEQAVSPRIAALHGTVAQQMGSGYGGVYYHLWGNMDPHVAERSQWLARPRGIEFRPILEGISQTATAPVSVWRRFMVLGPGLEFVILGNASLELQIPEGWAAHRVTRAVLS